MLRKGVIVLFVVVMALAAFAQSPADQFGFGDALANQDATAVALSDAMAADTAATAAQTLTAQDLATAQSAADNAIMRVETLREQVDEWWLALSNERVAEILAMLAAPLEPLTPADIPAEDVGPSEPVDDGGEPADAGDTPSDDAESAPDSP